MYIYDVNETPIKNGFIHGKPVFDCDFISSNLTQSKDVMEIMHYLSPNLVVVIV